MKQPAFLTALVAISVGAGSLAAQSADTARYPARGPSTHGLSIHSDYDSKYDKTVLQLDRVALDSTFAISALVALDGRVVHKEAPGVVISLWSTSPAKRFQQDRAVTLQIDGGAPISLGRAYLTPNPREGFTEVMITSASLDQWLALAKARQASFGVGALRFVLPATLLAAIRDFASRMAPVPAG